MEDVRFEETEIGTILKEWKIITLGESVEIIDGDRGVNYPSGSDFSNNGYCLFLNTKNVRGNCFDFSNKQFITEEKDKMLRNGKLKKNDIVLTTRGTVGNVAFYNDDVPFDNLRINSGMVILRNKKKFDLNFLFQLLKSKQLKHQIDELTTGSAQPQLPIKDLKNLKLIMPSLSDQKKIAQILFSFDDKIELNQKINSNLEKIASLLFKQWFVDFEFPNENGKPFKSSGGKMIDSELGEIPKGWSIGFLGDNKLTQLVKPGIDEFKGEKIYLPTANVNESSIVDLNYKITYYNRPSRANMQPFPNSIWFAKMKNSKKVQLFLEREKWKLKNVILSTGFTGIRPLSNSTFYIWTIINSDFFEREKSNLAIGTTMQAINNENIRRIRYIIPQKNILDCFEKKVCMLYEAISINKEQIKSFSKIRDSLLPRLMSGKIKVG